MSPTTERDACVMRWWPVPVWRCWSAAGDTGLTGMGLSIGQSVDSSTLRASKVQVQMWEKANWPYLQAISIWQDSQRARGSLLPGMHSEKGRWKVW